MQVKAIVTHVEVDCRLVVLSAIHQIITLATMDCCVQKEWKDVEMLATVQKDTSVKMANWCKSKSKQHKQQQL